MIKAVIFDYGGVIIPGGGANEPAESMSAFLHIPIKEAERIVSLLWDDYVAGRLSEEEYWRRVEIEHGQPIPQSINQTRSSWEQVTPLPEMITLIDELKAKGYIVGLLSNITSGTETTIRNGGGYDLFDPCILSCNVGHAKPGLSIYQELLNQLHGIETDEIVFIDDQQRYLNTAASLGIMTILAIDSGQIVQDLDNLLTNSATP